MITSKQRARLIGLASKLPTLVQIGKFGVSESVISQIDDALERRELIKIGVLKSCDTTAKDLLSSLAAAMQAEPVTAIGNKIILYRRSSTEGVQHIALDEAEEQAMRRAAERAERAKNAAAKASAATKKPYVAPPKKHGVHKGKGSDKKHK